VKERPKQKTFYVNQQQINFMRLNSKSFTGFSLIELMVSIFILSLVLGGMIAVFVSGFSSYSKAKNTRKVAESLQFALSSIAKDARMSRLMSESGSGSENLKFRRNIDLSWVCYDMDVADKKIMIRETSDDKVCGDLNSGDSGVKVLVDLEGTNLEFSENTKFRSSKTVTGSASGSNARGYVIVNISIRGSNQGDVESDQMNIQTTVSTRDYGWEENH